MLDSSNMEVKIFKKFDEWLQMVECIELKIKPDFIILVLGEKNNEYRTLWESLQSKTECRFVEIHFDELVNVNQKFDIIIDSQDPPTIYDNHDAYYKKLVVKDGFIFLFKMMFNCLVNKMKKVHGYDNATYELMTTEQHFESHLKSFPGEISILETVEDNEILMCAIGNISPIAMIDVCNESSDMSNIFESNNAFDLLMQKQPNQRLIFSGFSYNNNSCSWDSIMSSLLYVFCFLFDKNDREIMKNTTPKLHELLESIRTKEKTAHEVKCSWQTLLCEKYPLGSFRDTLTVINHVVEQYSDNDEHSTFLQSLFKVGYQRTSNCECSSKTTSFKTMSNIQVMLENPTKISESHPLFFHFIKSTNIKRKCQSCNQVQNRVVSDYPLVLFVKVAPTQDLRNLVSTLNLDSFKQQTSLIPTILNDNGVSYSLCCAVYAGDGHFVARVVNKGIEYEYDGLIDNGIYREVTESTGCLRPIISCGKKFKYFDCLVYKKIRRSY